MVNADCGGGFTVTSTLNTPDEHAGGPGLIACNVNVLIPAVAQLIVWGPIVVGFP